MENQEINFLVQWRPEGFTGPIESRIVKSFSSQDAGNQIALKYGNIVVTNVTVATPDDVGQLMEKALSKALIENQKARMARKHKLIFLYGNRGEGKIFK